MNNTKATFRSGFKIPAIARPFILSGSVAALLALQSSAFADTSWTGNAGDHDWTNPANWDNGVPSGQNAYIDSLNNDPILTSTPGFTPNDIYVGKGGTSGRLDVTGGTLSTGNGNWMQIGMDGGNGTFNLANTSATGGTLTGYGQGSGTFNTPNADFELGRGGGSVGVANINTSGSLNIGGTFSVGNYSGNGTVRMDNGTINASGNMILGQNSGTGTFSMSGGTVNLSGEGWIGQDSGGNGTVNISGGTFNANNYFVIGRGSGGTGVLTITGGNLVKSSNGQLIVGDNGDTGTLNINGGTVTTPALNRYGTGTVNFGGGTLQASASSSNFIDSGLAVNVNAAGGTIDSQANTIGTSATIIASGNGVLTKTGSGTFTLAGGSDNISLGAVVANGTLILGKTSSGGVHALGTDLTINGGATAQLGGSGGDQIYDAASVTANGRFDMNGQTETINNLFGSGSVVNTAASTASALTVGANNGSSTFKGVVSNGSGGTVAINKIGSGTLTVNSATANGFAPSQLTVTAGTLLLGSSNTIGGSTPLTLSGGTFNTGGNSQGTRPTAGIGSLTLSSTSTLDFGAGSTNSILHFASIGAHTPGSSALTITDWSGVASTGGGTEALLFDGTASTFTSEFSQSDVSFDGTPGYSAIQFSGYYEITAVPELGTAYGAAALLGAVGYRERRRFSRLLAALSSLKQALL